MFKFNIYKNIKSTHPTFLLDSDDKSPLISIITVVFNGEKHIEQTILSVLSQTYKNIEYILIDGDSSDNTFCIIKKYKPQISTFISEKDNGIADAMNKGIKYAKGDFLIFLHADDYFISEHVLEESLKYIDDNIDIVLADIAYGKKLKHLKSRGFNFLMNFKTGVFHQGAICRKSLFDNIGHFDVDLKIAMDYDFFLRAYQQKIKWKYCPITLSVMRDTGLSSRLDWSSLSKRFAEEKYIHKKNSTVRSMKILYTLYWFMYIPYRKLKFFIQKIKFN
jgi:glycosyltransferase involved in cell wall biosynthesis